MIPTPHPPAQAAHPEVSPGVWTWTAASQPIPPGPTQSHQSVPTSPPAKAIAAGVLVMAALSAGVGWRIHEAAYTAGAADAQAEIAQLESQASATNARIDAFCGAQ